MKPCLVDVNVLLALLIRQHQFHHAVREWFDTLVEGEACICRIVDLAVIRLLANPAIMGDKTLAASEAWRLMRTLLGDLRVQFVDEPPGIDSVLPTQLKYPIPTGKLINDAYLAAFAISSSRRLVTLDRGFRQFRELDVEVLGE